MMPEKVTDETFQIEQLQIDQIRTDGGTLPRCKIDEPTVVKYQEHLERLAAGEEEKPFPAVVVFRDPEGECWLADGYHRLKAHQLAGLEEIQAEVHNGTRREAVLFAVGANDWHGLPRSNADKRQAVEKLLKDSEWCQWANREIAKQCRVSESLVRKIREELSAHETQMTEPSGERQVQRGGKQYTMQTSGIGKSRSAAPALVTDGETPEAQEEVPAGAAEDQESGSSSGAPCAPVEVAQDGPALEKPATGDGGQKSPRAVLLGLAEQFSRMATLAQSAAGKRKGAQEKALQSIRDTLLDLVKVCENLELP
jgi:ParB-like chromosome segregation protein Spo0J